MDSGTLPHDYQKNSSPPASSLEARPWWYGRLRLSALTVGYKGWSHGPDYVLIVRTRQDCEATPRRPEHGLSSIGRGSATDYSKSWKGILWSNCGIMTMYISKNITLLRALALLLLLLLDSMLVTQKLDNAPSFWLKAYSFVLICRYSGTSLANNIINLSTIT